MKTRAIMVVIAIVTAEPYFLFIMSSFIMSSVLTIIIDVILTFSVTDEKT